MILDLVSITMIRKENERKEAELLEELEMRLIYVLFLGVYEVQIALCST